MAEDMERRDFIKSAGLVAGIAAASTLGQRSANAETAQQSGAKRMAYEIKPFSLDPKSVKGISEKILISHYENNYVGAVKRLNAIARPTGRTGLCQGAEFSDQWPQARRAGRDELNDFA